MAASAKKKHMDVFLREVFKQYIAIKDGDYKKAQTVFSSVFDQVKQKMCEQDNYYSKYANEVLNAGSVYDGIKVGKLDEFDLDVVVRLPISYEDGDNGILIEPHQPGFVKLKITSAFDNLDKQQDWEKCHKVTREWRDADKYFLQSRFRQWMQRVVQRAVNELGGRVAVGGTHYLLTFRESGPAYTLLVRNEPGADTFALDVDLVPCIRFMLPRWPPGYRSVEGGAERKWLVVPKPLKSLGDADARSRCWRLAFHDHEREIMKGCELLKLTIRLVKKLRDSLELKEIASYYIKTLFLWEIDERQDKKYWQNKVSVLFTDMVAKLAAAVDAKRIRYYWHKDHNLIAGLRPSLLAVYSAKLRDFLARLRANDVDSVVAYLLTPDELAHFRSSDLYKSFPASDAPPAPFVLRAESADSLNCRPESDTSDLLREILASNRKLEGKLDSLARKLENKVDYLTRNVDNLYTMVDGIKKEMNHGGIIQKDSVCSVARGVHSLTLSDEAAPSDEPAAGAGEIILSMLGGPVPIPLPSAATDLLINLQ